MSCDYLYIYLFSARSLGIFHKIFFILYYDINTKSKYKKNAEPAKYNYDRGRMHKAKTIISTNMLTEIKKREPSL